MSRFSTRNGLQAAKAIQIDGMDSDLRVGLWNVVSPAFFVYKRDYGRDRPPGYWPWERELGVRVWRDFFKYPVDTMPAAWTTIAAQIREWFFKAPWYEVYDLIEFMGAHAIDAGFNSENSMRFQETCNKIQMLIIWFSIHSIPSLTKLLFQNLLELLGKSKSSLSHPPFPGLHPMRKT